MDNVPGERRASLASQIAHYVYATVSLLWANIPVYMLGLGWLYFLASQFFKPLFGHALLSTLFFITGFIGSVYLMMRLLCLNVNTLPGGRTYLVDIKHDTLKRITRVLGVIGNVLVFFGRGSLALSLGYMAVWWILAIVVLPPSYWMRGIRLVAQLAFVQLLLLGLQSSRLWMRQ